MNTRHKPEDWHVRQSEKSANMLLRVRKQTLLFKTIACNDCVGFIDHSYFTE